MKNRIQKLMVLSLAVGGVASISKADTAITSFTAGDYVVLRGGDATNPASNSNQTGVYLDEYTTAGAYVGTINVPSTGGNALTLPGAADNQHEGVINISANGQYFTFAGYQADAGSADAFAQGGTSQYQPVVGVIGVNGSGLTTNTPVNGYHNGSSNPYIRGAYSNDGTQFWTFGKYAASGATSNGGLTYVSGTGPSATSTTVEGFADWRDIIGINGQLYGGTGSSSVGNHAPYIVANTAANVSAGVVTEPTTNLGTSLSLNNQIGSYPGGQSASGLAAVDLSGDPYSQNSVNVLYTIGDQSTAGIVKYYWNGTSWVNQTNVGLNATNNIVNPTGLIASTDPTNPNWVDLTVSGTNGIYTYVDTSGYNGAIPSNAFTDLVSPSTNEAFFGIAQVPTSVPEPASLALIGLGGLALLGRRRRA